MFARHLRRGRIRKLATFRRFAWTRKIVYDKYTGFFGTRQEPQKFIKFSDSSGNILIKFLPFYRGKGPQKILLYFLGKGAKEQKTNKWIKRVCLVKSEICDAYTMIFRTRREKHNLIKFSPFWERWILSNFRILRVMF